MAPGLSPLGRRFLQGGADGVNDLRLGRVVVALLRGDLVSVDPDGEFAAVSLDEVGIDSEGLLQLIRHTGGPGLVVSPHAISNRDAGHTLLQSSYSYNSRWSTVIPNGWERDMMRA